MISELVGSLFPSKRQRRLSAAQLRVDKAEAAFFSLTCPNVTDPTHRRLFHMDYADTRAELVAARAEMRVAADAFRN